MKTRRLESGQLEVIMEIQNKRNKDLWADIQVVFKDSDGVEVDKTNWEPKNVSSPRLRYLRKSHYQ
ncbi:MAG: hypothetical protein R3A45_06785 [Bdellovibrionota bacterium]